MYRNRKLRVWVRIPGLGGASLSFTVLYGLKGSS